MEYCGEVISQVNFIKRTQQYSDSGRKHFYFMSLQKDEVRKGKGVIVERSSPDITIHALIL